MLMMMSVCVTMALCMFPRRSQVRNAFSQNVSSSGMALLVSGKWRRDQEMSIAFDEAPQAAPIRARVTGQSGNFVRVQFEELSIHEQLTVTGVIYSRADPWLDWADGRKGDNLPHAYELGPLRFGLFPKTAAVARAISVLETKRPIHVPGDPLSPTSRDPSIIQGRLNSKVARSA
jgi:hypothetical protein